MDDFGEDIEGVDSNIDATTIRDQSGSIASKQHLLSVDLTVKLDSRVQEPTSFKELAVPETIEWE
jgi:hypothetical protein